MTTRSRGFWTFACSAAAGVALYWLLFHYLASTEGRTRLPAYPLALPLVGIVVGLLEWITGAPIGQIDEGWQRLPMYVKIPVAVIGGGLFLWAFLWIVAKGLGA